MILAREVWRNVLSAFVNLIVSDSIRFSSSKTPSLSTSETASFSLPLAMRDGDIWLSDLGLPKKPLLLLLEGDWSSDMRTLSFSSRDDFEFSGRKYSTGSVSTWQFEQVVFLRAILLYALYC